MSEKVIEDARYVQLIRDHFIGRLTEDDALLWMVLLHTHAIRLRSRIGPERNGHSEGISIAAVTQRHAAEVMSELWSERQPDDSQRSHSTYWYHQFNNRTPYELLSDVPDSLLPRLLELRDVLASDPRVAAVTPEE